MMSDNPKGVVNLDKYQWLDVPEEPGIEMTVICIVPSSDERFLILKLTKEHAKVN